MAVDTRRMPVALTYRRQSARQRLKRLDRERETLLAIFPELRRSTIRTDRRTIITSRNGR